MNLNRAFIMGNLTRDPELRALPSGGSVTSFSLAINRTYKDREGARKEDTEFVNVVAFGKQAETIAQFLRKGSSAFVEGRLQTRSWDNNGVKHFRTEVVADNVVFGPRKERPAVKEEETEDMPDENNEDPFGF